MNLKGKNTKEYDEMEEFLNEFDSKASEPRAEFLERLEHKTVERYRFGNGLNKFISIFDMSRKQFLYALCTCFGIAVFVGIVATLVYQNSAMFRRENRRPSLAEILSNAANNNSKVALESNFNMADRLTASAEGAGTYDAAALSMAIGVPSNPNANYFKNTMVESYGEAQNSCPAYNTVIDGDFEKVTSVNYSYNGKENENSYFKYYMVDEDGNVITYQNSKSSMTGYESIEYIGGSYAVKNINIYDNNGGRAIPANATEPAPEKVTLDAPLSADTPESVESSPAMDKPVSSDDTSLIAVDPNGEQYKDIFGTDPQELADEDVNGKSHYVILAKIDGFCQDYRTFDGQGEFLTAADIAIAPPQQDSKTILRKVFLDKETYAIAKEEFYFEEYTPAKLIKSVVYTNEIGENVDFSSVAENFRFEYNAPVKEIRHDYSNAAMRQSELSKTSEIIKNGTYQILDLAANSGWTFSNIAIMSEAAVRADRNVPTSYYSDKAFYPNTPYGIKQYELNIKNTDDAIEKVVDGIVDSLSLSYTNNGQTITMTTLASGVDIEDVYSANYYGIKKDATKAGAVTMRINSNNVNVDVYEFASGEYTILESAPSSTGSSGGGTSGSSGGASDLRIADPSMPSKPAPDSYKSYYGIVTYRGATYILMLSGTNSNELPSYPNMQTYSSKDAAGATKVDAMLREYFNSIYPQ